MNEALLQSKGSSADVIHSKVLKLVDSMPTHSSRLLDLGCGQGTFLNRVISLNKFQVTGADGYHYPELDSAKIPFLKIDLNSTLPIDDQTFDIVTAIEVIEHLENPRHFIREIHRILKPKGLAIITTPNNESITSLLSLFLRGYFSAFAPDCYPAHITPVLQIDLERILKELQFKNISTLYTNEGRLPGSSLHWQTIGKPFFQGKWFSDNYMMMGQKG